jgi:hypothetical protein
MMAPDLTPTPIVSADDADLVAVNVIDLDGAPQVAITITADQPAFGLRAGQEAILHLSKTSKIDCDAVFALYDGSFARVQSLFNGTYRVTGATETMQIIARADLPPVLGWIVQRREGGQL